MRTQKYKIADLKGMTLQVIAGNKSSFFDIEKVRFSEIPGRDFDLVNGNDSISLTDDEFFELIFDGETVVERQGIVLYSMFILDEPKRN